MAELSVLMRLQGLRPEARVLTFLFPYYATEPVRYRLWPASHTAVLFELSDINIIYGIHIASYLVKTISDFGFW